MKKNNIKLYEKRQKIKKDDLIIGMDIGSKFNSVVFHNKEGLILKSYAKVYNSRQGFNFLYNEIEQVKEKNKMKEVFVGFEPTGHYWKNIIYYLESQGYNVHFVRTTAVKSQRELDDSSSSKTDLSDANHIASLIREGKYIDSKIQHGVYKDLRDIGKLRARIMRMKTSMILRLRMLLEQFYPEILDCFWATDCVALWKLLKVAPFPSDIKKLSQKELIKILSVAGVTKKRLLDQVNKIQLTVNESIGLETNDTIKYNIHQCIESLELYHKQLIETKVKMQKLLEQTEYWYLMKSIPGVGVVTAATFLGELGDPSNFTNAKSIIKFAGLDPKENSSGLYNSGGRLSKKGRYLMRTIIYFISMRLIYRCDIFKNYYNRKLETKNVRGRTLEKKEALVAVGIKFIKVLFAMFRDKRMFEPKTSS